MKLMKKNYGIITRTNKNLTFIQLKKYLKYNKNL